MIPAGGDVEHAVKARSLAGGGQHGGRTAFERTDFRGDGVVRRVLQARVKIPFGLQIEQLAHGFAGIILKGRALDDGDLPRLAIFWRVAALYAFGAGFHKIILLKRPWTLVYAFTE